MLEDELFSVGQKAFIDRGSELLVLVDPILGYDFPGGKVQKGEIDFTEALRREVREETGLEIEVQEPFNVWYFEWPSTHRNAGKKACVIDYRCKFVSGAIRLSDEHTKYIWVNEQNYPDYFKENNIYFSSLKLYFSRK